MPAALRPATVRRDPIRPAASAPAVVHGAGVAPATLRVAVIAGCLLAAGLALWVGDPTSSLQADPSLGRLLRCMALIKGCLVLGAVGAVWWRAGWPLPKPVAAGYAAGTWVLTGSTMLIWQLSYIPLAAVLFHAAALGMLVVGWRERG